MNTEPAWMKVVKWPPCSRCRSTGVATELATAWPVECPDCTSARKSAVTRAQAEVRARNKRGDQ